MPPLSTTSPRSFAGARRLAAEGLAAGFVGTCCMTATRWLERRLRSDEAGPVDYDASGHVVTAAANALRWHPGNRAQRRALFLIVHWGYGSAVGIAYPPLLRSLCDDRLATSVFYVGCQSMAFTLFPTLGETPPPWRWRGDVLASSLAQHAVYAISVAATAKLAASSRS